MSTPDQDPTETAGFTVTPGLVISGTGAVVTLLAMFVFDWLESRFGMTAARTEIETFLDAYGSDQVLVTTELYFSFGWVIVLIAGFAAPAVTYLPQLKAPAAVTCALGIIWTLFSTYDFVATFAEGVADFSTGVWLAVAGPALAMVGALISQPDTVPVPGPKASDDGAQRRRG